MKPSQCSRNHKSPILLKHLKRHLPCLTLLVLVAVQLARAEEATSQFDPNCNITGYTETEGIENTQIRELTRVADDLNRSISDSQRGRFNYCLGDKEQYSWTNVPGRRSGGIRIEDLSVDQEELVWSLLKNFLSPDTYKNVHFLATDIEEASGAGTILDYTIALFGNPGFDSAWGFQFDGHHIALNFVVDANQVVLSPAFLGSQPTTLNGVTPLRSEKELGRSFISSLRKDRKEYAYVPNLVRRDVLVGSGRGQVDQGTQFNIDDFDQIGLRYKNISYSSRKLFHLLLDTYTERLNDVFTKEFLLDLRQRIEHHQSTYFVYSTDGDRLYYRIYVEDGILIEYSDVASDHIHTVVRLLGPRPHHDYGGFVENNRSQTSMIVQHLLTAEHHKDDLAEILATSH